MPNMRSVGNAGDVRSNFAFALSKGFYPRAYMLAYSVDPIWPGRSARPDDPRR